MVGNTTLPAAIAINNLRKCYTHKKRSTKLALDNVNLTIPNGCFFGLLGPNGAGKSTLINILAGIVVRDSGQVAINGFDIDTETRQAKKSIGIVPQELVLDPFFPVREVLENTAGYYGIRKKDRRTEEIIAAVGLTDKANAPARSLSGGMRRRLLVAKAMVHNPAVLVLDEPTAGVDVQLREQLWEYVRQLNKEGTTILLTTHYLEEAEQLCDRIAIIDHGKIIIDSKKDHIMKLVDKKKVTFTPKEKIHTIPLPLQAFDSILLSDGKIEVHYHSKKHAIEDIIQAFMKSKLTLSELATEEADLEDIFKHLIKHESL